MRQVPLSPSASTTKRVANVPPHPPPSTRLMPCACIAKRLLPRIIGASTSTISAISQSRLFWHCEYACNAVPFPAGARRALAFAHKVAGGRGDAARIALSWPPSLLAGICCPAPPPFDLALDRFAHKSCALFTLLEDGRDARQRPGRQLCHNPFRPTQFSPHAWPNSNIRHRCHHFVCPYC
jgi:hypothetical protein